MTILPMLATGFLLIGPTPTPEQVIGGRDLSPEELRAVARDFCREPRFPHDTKIIINARRGSFRCELPKEYDRD